MHVNVAALADFDNDGDEDLISRDLLRAQQAVRKRRHGRFTDVTKGSGLGAGDMTAVVAVVDVDNDGASTCISVGGST